MFLVPFFDLQNFILLVRTVPFLRKIIFNSSYTAKNNYFLLYELIQDLPYHIRSENTPGRVDSGRVDPGPSWLRGRLDFKSSGPATVTKSGRGKIFIYRYTINL